MAEAKKEEKKDVKKDTKKKGVNWEDFFLLILGLITIFFVIIPQLSPTDESDSQTSSDGTTNSSVNSSSNQGIVGIYQKLFGPKTKTVVDTNGRVTEVISGPSIVEEAKFRLSDLFTNILSFLAILSIFASALFGIVWYYNSFRLKLITEEYLKNNGLKKVEDVAVADQVIPAGYVPDTNGLINPKWELVEKYYNSGNQSDWRLAIIEADILLFEVLQSSGFKGETIGDMLKGTNVSQLQSLQTAWKSHLVRNRLAHEGSNMTLSRQLVEETIEGFRTVFTELNFI